MGITKKEGFTDEVIDMAEVLKAIGHPARLAIIEFLSKSSSCICSDIIQEIPLAQPTISRHLSELKKIGLIQGTIEGKNTCYCINEKRWDDIKVLIKTIALRIEGINKCCK